MTSSRLKHAIIGAAGLTLVGALFASTWPAQDGSQFPRPIAHGPEKHSPTPSTQATAQPLAIGLWVRVDDEYRRLHLPEERLGPVIGRSWSHHLIRLADGGLLCVCTERRSDQSGDKVAVGVRWLTETAQTIDEFQVGVFRGEPDSVFTGAGGGAGSLIFDEPTSTLYLGRVLRNGAFWHLAVDVVDIGARRVVQSIDLEPVPVEAEGGIAETAAPDQSAPLSPDEMVHAWVPTIDLAPDGGHLAVRSTSVYRGQIHETRYWVATVEDGRVGRLVAWPLGKDTVSECGATWSGFATVDTYFALCYSRPGWSDGAFLRRVHLDGTLITDVPLGVRPGQVVVDRDRSLLFSWDPFSTAAARIDLVSGDIRTTPAADRGGLEIADVLRSWIAPPARAKWLLEPALAISPDGSRLYGAELGGMSSSRSAIWVLDSETLEVVERWEVSGLLTSIALSADGSLLFSASSVRSSTSAEVTIHSTADGSMRLRTADLDNHFVMFVPELMPAAP